MPGPAPLTSGFVAINKTAPVQTSPKFSPEAQIQAHDVQKINPLKQANQVNHGQPPHEATQSPQAPQVPSQAVQPSPPFIPKQMPPPTLQQYAPQYQYQVPQYRPAIRPDGDPMELDDGNDSEATVSEKEDGHVDYEPIHQTINLGPYHESIPFIFSPPRHVPFATSVEVVTLLMDTPQRVRPLWNQEDTQSEHAFMERLFNIGNIIGKGGHVPLFSSSTGEYRFLTDRDREIAASYGFANEEQMFKYLDDIKGTGYIPDPDEKRFQAPWHEIDVVFEPRKRGNVEPSKRKPKALKADEPAKEEQNGSPPNETGEDTIMTNGDATELTAMSNGGPSSTPSMPVDGPPVRKKKYQVPKRIPVDQIVHPICMEDLIHAVTRHPLLLPSDPVSVEFIIAHAPHLLQNVGLLYVLAHGEIENEGLSERLGKLGLDVAPNVLAHRKKKALMDLGGDYNDHKPLYEAYKKTLKRKPGWRKGTSGLGLS